MAQKSITYLERKTSGFQKILRNVTNTIQAVSIPGGAIDLEIIYQHVGSNAGNLIIVPEAYSILDAQQRAARDDAHLEVLDNARINISFSANTRPTYIYIRTTNARSTDTTDVFIRSRAPAVLSSLVTTKSPRLFAAWDCVQASPDSSITDLSGNGNHCTWDSGSLDPASVWATLGYYSNVLSGTHYPESDQTTWENSFNPTNGDILVVTGKVLASTPASSDTFLSTGYSTSVNGFRFRVGTDGRLSCAVHSPTETVFLGYTSSNLLADGSEHSFAAVLDFTNGTGILYVDDEEQTGGVSSFTPLIDTVAPRGWMFGAQPNGTTLNVASSGTFDGKVRDVRVLVFPGGYNPTVIRTLISKLHSIPQYLPTSDDAP